VPQYILSRLPLLRVADDKTRKSKARVLALLSAMLQMVGQNNTLRMPEVSFALLCFALLCFAWLGFAWLGLAWLGLAWLGLACIGLYWLSCGFWC